MNASESAYLFSSLAVFGAMFGLDMWYSFRYNRIIKYEVGPLLRRIVKRLRKKSIFVILAIYAGLVYWFYSTFNGNVYEGFAVLWLGAAYHGVLGLGFSIREMRKVRSRSF